MSGESPATDESASERRQARTPRPTSVRVEAPAKLNLLLRVLGRESSGFHSIETLFIKLALHDVVHIDTSPSGRSLDCDGPSMPEGGLGPVEQNLAWRAAVRFAEAARWPTGFSIRIEKHIPVGGGLGGGSADAAAVLRGLNRLSPEPLDGATLIAIAGELGSDVPFLVSDALLAWGWGRGDRLLSLPALPARRVDLITFSEGVNTGEAYRALNRPIGESTPAQQWSTVDFGSWGALAGLAQNDFEAVVESRHAGVARWLPLVRAQARRRCEAGEPSIGLMSGSGATCFLLCSATAPVEWPATGPGERVVRTSTASAIVPSEPTA